MRIVALVSGGKDSCFSMVHCVLNGHQIVALANLMPEKKDELDSYMYQTVGHDVIQLYSEAVGLPLFRRTIQGGPLSIGSNYVRNADDEVEDMYELLKQIKEEIDYDAVTTGAILSNYQRVRVENVCGRLELKSLSYLWQRDQVELLSEMIDSSMDAILVKVASLGLNEQHLGKSLKEMQPHLLKMKEKYGMNVCGEGGEYETMTLDCPLFIKTIVIDESEVIIHSDDAFAPVGYLKFRTVHLEDKSMNVNSTLRERLNHCTVPRSLFLEESFPEVQTHQQQEQSDIDGGIMKSIVLARHPNKDIICKPCFSQDERGKIWLSNVICRKDDSKTSQECTTETLQEWRGLIEKQNYNMRDVCLVHVACANMEDFTAINSIYKTYFTLNPPARVFIQASLPTGELFRLDSCLVDQVKYHREALHVQSISYWAPANIGPYSQAVKAYTSSTKTVYFSGSIALDPSSMQVITTGFENEAMLALKHVNKVSQVISPDIHHHDDINTCVCGCIVCYVTEKSMISHVENWFQNQTYFNPNHYLLNPVSVPRLPRNAKVEWHVTAKVIEICDDENEWIADFTMNGSHRNPHDDTTQRNAGYFRLCLSRDDFTMMSPLFDNIRSKLQDIRDIKSYLFARCYFVQQVFPDETALQNVVHNLLASLKHSLNISFIPVTGLSGDFAVALVCET